MKKGYFKEFLHRGLLAAGFGPVVAAIVCFIVGRATGDMAMTTDAFFVATITSFLLAFLVAGSSMLYQIDHWGLAKSTFCHLAILYVCYLGCYLLNRWIAPDLVSIAIFTGIFALGYLVIWGVVLISVKLTAKKLNDRMAKNNSSHP